MPGVGDWPLWGLVAGFLGAATVVWFAGTRLSRHADQIARRTGASHAVVGLLLLGGITSLPEVAVSVTGALSGETALAVNNILGSVAAQVALLAVADAVIGRRALTSVVLEPGVLLQATFNIMLLAVIAAAITIGDRPLLGAGAWSWSLLLGYGLFIWVLSREGGEPRWRASGDTDLGADPTADEAAEQEEEAVSALRLGLNVAMEAALILGAGYLLSRTGASIADRSGLGSAFFGATFVAVATSLPEISTMVAAVRLRRYEMALGDIFGTNLFNGALIFLIDAVAPGPPVLGEVGAFSAFGALLGLVLTAIFLAGVLERRDRTILRMGWDSLAAILVYGAGVVMLWQLRG